MKKLILAFVLVLPGVIFSSCASDKPSSATTTTRTTTTNQQRPIAMPSQSNPSGTLHGM